MRVGLFGSFDAMKGPKTWSIIIIVFINLFTALCIYNIFNLELDHNFEKFYSQDDPDTQFFQEYRKTFSSDNDFLLMAVRNEEGVFRKDFLLKVRDLLGELDSVNYIDTVLCVTRMDKRILGKKIPYINYDQLDSLHNDSIWIANSPDVLGSQISEDYKSLLIYLKHRDYLSAEKCRELAAAMNGIRDKYHFDTMHIAGRAVGQVYYVNLMSSELGFFTILSILLLLAFLILAYRSWWGIVIPILVVVLAVVWILGIMGMIGQPLNLMLIVLPTIMFVVGMSDVVHVISKYLEELRSGSPKLKALRTTVREVGIATLLTSVTTAVGFLTLLTSPMEPIRDFGLFVAIGVMIAFVMAFLLMPSMFALLPKPRVSRHASENTFWTRALRNWFGWVIRNQKKVGLIALVVLILCGLGMSRLRVDNFLLEDLSDTDPMNESFLFFDSTFSGVRPLEISVQSDSTLLSVEGIGKLKDIENAALEIYPNRSFLSVLTGVRVMNRIVEGGANQHYIIPTEEKALEKILKRLKKWHEKGRLNQFLSGDGKHARFSTTVPDLGGSAYMKLHTVFFDQINGKYPELEIRQTGTAYLIDKNIQYMARSILGSLAIAFGVVALIVGLMYRSLRMVLISLVPNVFPLIMIAGIMGAFDLEIKMSTSILFTIAFGIAVDDTIHFISKLRLELAKGKTTALAIRRTYMSTGRAIVLTTGILCAGFLTLIFSSFLGTFYMGLSITLALIFALIADLFLLPVLVLNFYKGEK